MSVLSSTPENQAEKKRLAVWVFISFIRKPTLLLWVGGNRFKVSRKEPKSSQIARGFYKAVVICQSLLKIGRRKLLAAVYPGHEEKSCQLTYCQKFPNLTRGVRSDKYDI